MATTKNITHDTTADVDVACQSEHGYIADKSRLLARLKRVEGQARGIHRWWTKRITASTSPPRSADQQGAGGGGTRLA